MKEEAMSGIGSELFIELIMKHRSAVKIVLLVLAGLTAACVLAKMIRRTIVEREIGREREEWASLSEGERDERTRAMLEKERREWKREESSEMEPKG